MKTDTGQLVRPVLNLLLAVLLALVLFGALHFADPVLSAGEALVVPRPRVERCLLPHEQSARLVQDLLERNDLIPFEGALGAIMSPAI